MISTYQLIRPADPKFEQHYLTLAPLKQLIAAHCTFLACCCQLVQEAGIARIKERFAYTWQKRLAAYHGASEGLPSDLPLEFRLGLVGAGYIGSHVARRLLDAGFSQSQLLVATRSPQRAKDLSARGVQVTTDVESVASSTRLLILAVLPAHLPEVARSLRKSLSRQTLIISLVSGVSRAKLISLLGVQSIIVLHTEAALVALQAHLHLDADSRGGRAAPSKPTKKLTLPLLRVSAESFMPSVAVAAELVGVLPVVLNGLELSAAELMTVSVESLLGSPAQVRRLDTELFPHLSE